MLHLEYKPDFEEVRRCWDAFWSGEIIDRPFIVVKAPKEGVKQFPHPPYPTKAGGQYRNIVQQFDKWASTTFFGAEALPFFDVAFGTDQFASFLGETKLDQSKLEVGTTWSVPLVKDWRKVLPFRLQEDNCYWQEFLKFHRCVAKYGDGKFLSGMSDLHSNLDGLAAMRGVEQTCIDLVEEPELMEMAMRSVSSVYTSIYEGIYEAGNMAKWGTIGWTPFYCRGKFATIQCDEICLISPEMARRFVIPALEDEASYLDHSVYHLDGPDSLVHLDDILAISKIDVIQWVPGTGQPPLIKWMDLLRKIQASGKGLHIYGLPEEVKMFHRELKPERVLYDVSAASQSEAEDLIKWLETHT